MHFLIYFEVTLFLNIGYNHLLLTRKRSIKDSLVIFIINHLIVLLGLVFYNIFFKDSILYNFALFSLGFSFIIYIFFVFEESFSKKIFNMFTIWVFSNIILILCSYIVGLFYIQDYSTYRTLSTLFKHFIQLLIMPIIYLYFQDPYKEMLKLVSNKVINIISFYSIMVFLFLVNYYGSNPNKPIYHYNFFNSLMFIVIIILSYIIIFIAIYSVNRNVELEYKYKFIDTQLKLQKQNYKTLNKSIENYYSFKHDIRHHLLAMKSMMDAKNYIAVSEYLDKFNENEICQNIGVLCENFTIDSILKYYMNIALNYSIDFQVNVNIPQDINIEDLDLSIVIGNCVENAIEACNNIMDERKKYINIKAELKGSHLILKIKNSFNGHVIEEDNILRTCKTGEGHGIGLSNVRKVTEKYNGYFKVKYNGNEFEVDSILNYN